MNKVCFIKYKDSGMAVEFCDKTETFNLSYWSYGFQNKFNIKDRIIYCFKCLFLGKPFLEQIKINEEGAKQLCVYLQKYNKKLTATIKQAIQPRN
jgi:hypothetical protein